MLNKGKNIENINKETEIQKIYKEDMTKCVKKFLTILAIYALLATSSTLKDNLNFTKKQKIAKEVENNDTDKLLSTIVKYTPEEQKFKLERFWQNNINNLTTEEICKILKNAKSYSQDKMKNKEVYEIALNYLDLSLVEQKATFSLFIIQNFIGEDDILKLALLQPEELSLKLKEKYGESFFWKLHIWVDSINKHKKSIALFVDEIDLHNIYPANDIEKVLLKPYSYEQYNSFFNEEEDVHYEYYCRLDDRQKNKYLIGVYDKYFNGQTYEIPNTKTPYDLVEEKIKEEGKDKIIAMLQKRRFFDGTIHKKEKNDGYHDYDTLTLDLLSMIDSETVTFKENETYEEYFEKLENRFPTLDIYRFNNHLIDSNNIYDYNIYNMFIPLYLEMLSKKEVVTEDDIINYTEIYMIFYRESKFKADEEFEKTVSCYLNPIKAQFDSELKNILRAKAEENLISLVDNTLDYKLELVKH